MRQIGGVVIDVDGTLLDPAQRLTRATAAAVGAARSAGLEVILASGRSARALVGVLAELGLDGPAIAFGGALTFRVAGGAVEPLAATPIAQDVAATAHALARAAAIDVGWFTIAGWRAVATGPGIEEEAALTDEPPVIDPRLPDGAPPPLKLMCIAATRREAAALGGLRERLPAGAHGVFSHPRYLEVMAAGVGKAPAVAAAAAALGLDPRALAAIGDAENDVELLRSAGLAIAMGNAAPEVIAVADHVTGSNARDGVARALTALLDGSLGGGRA
jgi:Cof subfamily protein (haloacid dehalogenase superfamily)